MENKNPLERLTSLCNKLDKANGRMEKIANKKLDFSKADKLLKDSKIYQRNIEILSKNLVSNTKHDVEDWMASIEERLEKFRRYADSQRSVANTPEISEEMMDKTVKLLESKDKYCIYDDDAFNEVIGRKIDKLKTRREKWDYESLSEIFWDL